MKNQIYIGSTNNLRRRFKEHNDGEVFSSKPYRPWSLFYYEAYSTERPARIREQRLKDGGNAIKELKKRIGGGLSSTASGAGFTLIEIIVAVGILLVIMSLGLFISMDFFRSYSFHSEKSTLVSALQNARSQSENNIDQVRHGVHFQGPPFKYVIFECPTGTPQCASYASGPSDLTINSSYKITVISPSLPFDIIFDQLNGDCISCASPVNIQINDGIKTYTVSVNSEGRIDW